MNKNLKEAILLYIKLKFFKNVTQVPFIFIDITGKCNSLCEGCIFGKDRNQQFPELDKEVITSQIPSMKALQTRTVSLGGGEPLLRKDLEDIIKVLTNNDIKVHINTNATLLTESRVKSLSEAGLSSINISLDHIDVETYQAIRGINGAQKVLDAINLLASYSLKPAVNIVVSEKNVHDLINITHEIVKYPVSKIQFIPLNNSLVHKSISDERNQTLRVKNLDDLPEVLQECCKIIKDNKIMTNSDFFIQNFSAAYYENSPTRCYAGSLFLTIDMNGNVMPCYEHQNGLNLHKMTLLDIVNSGQYKQALNKVKVCRAKCWDVGSAEPSIRMRVMHNLKNLSNSVHEINGHL